MSLENLLGFTSKEKRLYNFLDREPQNVADIARGASLPRMTTYYILQRFRERGLVKRVKRENQFRYFLIPPEEVFVDVLSANNVSLGNIVIPLEAEEGITIHRGMDGIYTLYERVCTEKAKERVYGIQTTISTEYIYNHYSLEELDRLHVLMTKNELIIEDIIEEDFFRPIYERYESGFESAVQTFLDRMLATYALPKGYLTFKSDMVIFNNVVIFIDWEKQVALEVRIQQVVNICLDLFRALKTQTRHIQFRELAKKYID